MLVLIQWAKSAPEDWTEYEIVRDSDWLALPDKGIPTSLHQSVDNSPGWINALNIQGVIFSGYDRYSITTLSEDGLRVRAWQDSADFAPGTRWASEWMFLPPAPDPRIGDRINTRQSRVFYSESSSNLPAGVMARAREWSDFSSPSEAAQRFGKWLSDELFAAHMRALSVRGWREWVR